MPHCLLRFFKPAISKSAYCAFCFLFLFTEITIKSLAHIFPGSLRLISDPGISLYGLYGHPLRCAVALVSREL
jgi:hypothetical protein